MLFELALVSSLLLVPQSNKTHATAPRPTNLKAMEPTGSRVLWRREIPAPFVHHRPAVCADGRVFVNDVNGVVHAFSPSGVPLWTFDLEGQGASGPCAVGADGAVYVVGDPAGPVVSLFALRPDGSLNWVFSDTGAQGVIAGPGVGPDGNVYVVTEIPGAGLVSLTPEGQVRWSRQGSTAFFESGQLGAELAFGSSSPGGPADRVFLAFDMIGTGAGQRMFGFDLDGDEVFTVNTGAQTNNFFLQPQAQPVTGPDGRPTLTTQRTSGWALEAYDPSNGSVQSQYQVLPANGMSPPSFDPSGNAYLTRSLSFLASATPSGAERWSWFDGSILYGPTVSPDGSQLLLAGLPNFGQPGFLRAFDTLGNPLWKIDLPTELGPLVPDTRATFSPSGNAAYLVVQQPAGGTSAPAYLYALDMTH